jgi:calcineurin-like phosphoesterase family protein
MSDEYSVKFGRTARTLEYDDTHGQVIFTFDVGSEHGKSLVLEHYPSSMARSPRYDVAFDRTKQFLEARGYDVQF